MGTHYEAIRSMMMLREDMGRYVQRLNNESVVSGLPMMRPMFLQFPTDKVAAANQAEMQFMFGPDWLVAPVFNMSATTWPAYLPSIEKDNADWVYWWNQTVVKGGAWVSVDVSQIGHFPLFFKRPRAQLAT